MTSVKHRLTVQQQQQREASCTNITIVTPVNQLSVEELCLLCSLSCSMGGPDPYTCPPGRSPSLPLPKYLKYLDTIT